MYKLEIEYDQHFDIKSNERICKLCNKAGENEFHFLMSIVM